jgi:hypothetical protein
MRDTFWVGIYPGMTEAMAAYMVQTIAEFQGKNKHDIYFS